MSVLQPGQTIKPIVSLAQAKILAKEHFGIEVTSIKEMDSYDDKNFCIENQSGTKFTLKVLNSLDSARPWYIEAQHDVLNHLKKNGIACPIACNTLEGSTFVVVQIPEEANGNGNNNEAIKPKHLVRLLTFVKGMTMYGVTKLSDSLLYKTGLHMAQTQKINKELVSELPVLKSHKTLWILGETLELHNFLYVLQDPKRVALVTSILTAFEKDVVPLIPTLESGIIHGDYNEQNILVTPSSDGDYDISGIIDFADTHIAPIVFDYAICLCYMLLEAIRHGADDKDFNAAGHFMSGYSQVRSVPDIELKLIRTLVACRLCQSLVLGAYTHSQDPSNDYVLLTAKRGWSLLENWWNGSTDQDIISICTKYIT